MPRSLATRISRPATSRTWPTEPGAPVSARGVEHLHRVDHAHVGPLGLDRRDHGVEVGLGDDRHRAARPAPRRSARSRTWAADSSPET